MANVRDSDTSLWLHNKLGTSNDSWISGSICSQLNKEVLRNIKECFSDLQTQVKLKLLLSFFHIPRRLVEEWKTELEEVIEVAGLDSELWVSMLAETMKTFPASSSLNTEISDYEDTRPIFTDMVNDLRKLVSKHSDLGMLPLECQYLNKNALVSVVGQQPNPVKHFTLKRKPKSANLRTELLHKSADAQSSLKKNSAPTIPLRSRGMPRKMTDTTPLKGIPSRVPTSGFRSPNVPANQQRPNLSRTPAGRKDGGIKLIEFTDQPLGYAAAKKRKREQQLEEQQKKAEQKANAAAAAGGGSGGGANTSPTASPTQMGSGAAAGTPTTPTTPTSAGFEIKTEAGLGLSLSGDDGTDLESPKETIALKTEPATPEYAPTLTYSVTPNSSLGVSSVTMTAADIIGTPKLKAKSKANAGANAAHVTPTKVHTVSVQTQAVATSAVANNNNNNNNNNNSLSFAQKRIKQEIEIKSEEIIVPANIKVEKIEPQHTPLITSQTILQPAQKQPVRLQQRVIIQQQPTAGQQQQPQAQHVLIRAAPQQQKPGAGLGGAITLTSNNVGAGAMRANNSHAPGTPIKMEKLEIKPLVRSTPMANSASTNTGTILTQQQLRQAANPLANLPNNISVKITSTKTTKTAHNQTQQHTQQQQQQQQPILINSSTPVILSSAAPTQTIRQKQLATSTAQTIKSMPLSQLKTAANNGPVIISQTIIQPAKRTATGALSQQQQQQQHHQQQPQQIIQHHQQQQQQQTIQQGPTQYILTSSAQHQTQNVPGLTTFAQARPLVQQTSTVYQTSGGGGQTPTKILLKTSPTSGVMVTPMRQQQTMSAINNPPPLVATSATGSQPTLLNIQNVQLPNRQVTIQPASHAAQQQHLQAQLQQQQPQTQHTIVSNTSATQQPKLTQVLMQSQPVTGAGVGGVVGGGNVKNKTIILTQKGVILRNIGGDMYQQIPISNVSGLQGLGTTLVTTNAGPPGLVKTTMSGGMQQQQQQQQTIQLHQTTSKGQQLPTLIPTNALAPQTMIVQQQQQQQGSIIGSPSQQTIIRPMMANLQGGLTTLPQGLTLIQRPGQQPQLVQVQTTSVAQQQQQPQLQRTIITQPVQQQQMRQQQIVLQHKATTAAGQQQQRIITTTGAAGGQQIQIQQGNPNITRTTHIVHQVAQQPQQQQTQQAPQRKGLSLSNEHVHKAHEMFRKANRVSRPDKALILGFMAGMRENPRPNSENVIVIKLGDSEEKVQQEDGSTALCLVESHIRLDYNTGEWKTFQNYRRLDQGGGGVGNQSDAGGGGSVMQAQVI